MCIIVTLGIGAFSCIKLRLILAMNFSLHPFLYKK
jgi:hypothetical protein